MRVLTAIVLVCIGLAVASPVDEGMLVRSYPDTWYNELMDLF